jgi:hypothetical protein
MYNWEKIIKIAVLVRHLGLCLLLLVCGMFSLLDMTSASAAGFATNFVLGTTGNAWDQNNQGSCPYNGCPSNIGNTDPTPFAEEVINISGALYYHTIVGDPATGFAQESYTRAGPAFIQGSTGNEHIGGSGGGFSVDGGGNLFSVIGNINPTALTSVHDLLNSANPLGDFRVSGTGGNAPDHSVFRMVMTSPTGDMSMEVDKPFLDKKPKISQTVQDGGMTSTFVTDERGLNYQQNGTAAPVVNTLVLTDPSIPGAGAADFSMALAQQSTVTAGRFIYTPGSGWNDPSLGWDSTNSTFGFGTYSYIDGQGFDPLNFDWSSVFDYAQNANACSVPAAADGFVREQSGNFGGSCFNKP